MLKESQPSYEIPAITTPRIFNNSEWANLNGFNLETISYESWELRGSVIEETENTNADLYIPQEGLYPWQVIPIISDIDYRLFPNEPEKQFEAFRKIIKLGQTFQAAGIYIAQGLPTIEKGWDIAASMATQLYNYGELLEFGKNINNTKPPNELAVIKLNFKQIKEVDRFLTENGMIYHLIQSEAEIQNHPDRTDDIYERDRRASLKDFFETFQDALELKETHPSRINLSSLEKKLFSSHMVFINQFEDLIRRQVEQPLVELESAIYDWGIKHENTLKINFYDLAILHYKEAMKYKGKKSPESKKRYYKHLSDSLVSFERIMAQNPADENLRYTQEEDFQYKYGTTLLEYTKNDITEKAASFTKKRNYLQKAIDALNRVIDLNPLNRQAYRAVKIAQKQASQYQEALVYKSH
jgi:hypothetical protein